MNEPAQRRRGEKRAAILRAAAALFAERGAQTQGGAAAQPATQKNEPAKRGRLRGGANVGVDEIAARAGVSKATLYRYFPSKAALRRALAAEHGTPEEATEEPDRRGRILEAALQVMPQYGIRATTMEQIAEVVGISPATIYWHFKSKDELVMAMVDRFNPLREVQAALAAGATGDPANDLRALVRLMLDVLGQRFEVMQMCMVEAPNNPALAAHVFQTLAMPVWGTLAAYLEAHVQAGRLRPAPPLPRVFTFAGSVLAFTLARRALGPLFPISSDVMAETLVDTFLQGAATEAYRETLKRVKSEGACPACP